MIRRRQNSQKTARNLSSSLLSGYLIWSVIISVGIVSLGIADDLLSGQTGYGRFSAAQLMGIGQITGFFPYSVHGIISGSLAMKPFAIIQLGVLILLLSPFGRVMLQILIFIKERDRPFIWISATVLFILISSFYVGGHI